MSTIHDLNSLPNVI